MGDRAGIPRPGASLRQTSREPCGPRARAGAHCLSLPAQEGSAGVTGAQSPGAPTARTRKQRWLRPLGSARPSPAAQGLNPQTRRQRGHTGGSRDPVHVPRCPARVITGPHLLLHGGAALARKRRTVSAFRGERSARAGAPEPLPQGPLRGRPKSPGRRPTSAAVPAPRQPDYSSQDASGGGAALPGTLRARRLTAPPPSGGTGPARAGGRGGAGAREVRISARRPQHERGPRTSP